MIRLVGLLSYIVISAICKTLRWELQGPDTLDEIFDEYKSPIMCGWHDRLFVGAYYLRNRRLVILTSQSLDGEYAARCANRFGFGVVRGSSTRGGTAALVEMTRLAKDGAPTFFLIDGPRGPRRKVKPGAIMLAKTSGCPIIAGAMQPTRCWTMRSWDRMEIPKPFSRMVVVRSPPIYVSPDADANEIQNKCRELQNALDDVVRKANEMAAIK